MNLEPWYKNIIENSTEYPPEKVWEGIQDELDIDLVWNSVDRTLYNQRNKKRMAAFAIAASLLFAVVFGAISYYMMRNNSINETDLAQQNSEQILPVEPSLDQAIVNQKEEQTPTVNKSTPGTISEIVTPEDLTPSFYAESTISEIEPSEDPTPSFYPESIISDIIPSSLLSDINYSEIRQFSPVSDNGVSMNELLAEAVTNQPVDENVPVNKSKERAISSMYIGFSGNIANTWMLNNKTLQGMKSTEFTATHPSFGKSYGILMGTNLTKRLGITTQLFLKTQNKQNYNEYLSGKYVSNKLELDYFTFLFQLKYHLNKYPNSHSLHFGTYSAIMKNATQNLDGIVNEISNEYNNWDYGLVIGYEYPLLINSRVTFSTIVFTKIGLNNVFSGNESIPYYLNKTRNASLNLSFSVNYSIFQ